ncbi:hypothetical protein B9G55_06115 [Saccharibacillus sp. O16]|nr:hypothetical protein B9G55_06115 [Saccharibacillus sp. O16]
MEEIAMKPIRKHFDREFALPMRLSYKETKSPTHELPDHHHEWYEFVYVYEGKGSFFIDQAFYEMRPGDVIVIPGNTVHRAFPDQEKPVTSSALFFGPELIHSRAHLPQEAQAYLQLFETAKQQKQYHYALSREHCDILERDLDALRSEWQPERPDAEQALSLLLHLILLHLNRYCLPQTLPAASSSSIPQWLGEALAQIDQHLFDPLELNRLAARATVSPAHFSRVFKQRLGMNLTEYLSAKRIFAARDRLLRTNHKVEQIALECGFDSLPHFYRTFKKYTQATPSAYRKRAREQGFPVNGEQ